MHGVKRLFGWMIPRFDASRYRVSLVSLRKKDLSEEPLESMGVDITYLARGKFDPRTLSDLLRVIDAKKIDVLHCHGYGATTFGRLAGALRRLPVVLHEHANLTSTPWFQQLADVVLERFTDIGIAVSESTAEFVVKARKVRPGRVFVTYLGAPLDEFSRTRSTDEVAAVRGEHGITPGDFAIGTITRLHDSKGNSYLVEAARSVVDLRPNAKFLLFGEGPLLDDLKAQAAALNLGDRFIFGGFVKDVARLLHAFDVSAFPSLWEGTPLTVFEAMAASRPIVATDADGLLDVLTDEHDAVIVPKRNADALAQAIVRMIDEPATRARLSANARETANRFDIAAFVRKMERLYELLHAGSRATGRGVVESEDLSFLIDPRRREQAAHTNVTV